GVPAGSYLGRMDGSLPYDIYSRKDGWIDIGPNAWVKEEYFDVR
ncbi:N-acetylmuramoyl-L-alanine amidase, partial [Bacillus cereus]